MVGIPSESFQRAIHLFDPLLSIRASTYLPDKWIIERDAWVPEYEVAFLRRRRDRLAQFMKDEKDPKKLARTKEVFTEIAEEFESARAKRRIVLFTGSLDRRVFDLLAAGDTQRYGGYSRFIDEMEKREKEREEKLEKELTNLRDDLHSEAFDKLNFLWDKKLDKLQHYAYQRPLSELIR